MSLKAIATPAAREPGTLGARGRDWPASEHGRAWPHRGWADSNFNGPDELASYLLHLAGTNDSGPLRDALETLTGKHPAAAGYPTPLSEQEHVSPAD